MALANITPRIRKEYLDALLGNHASYVARPLSVVTSPDEATEVVLQIVPEATYLDTYLKLSASLKASTSEVEATPTGRRILARSPSGKALPSGYLDKATFDICPKDVVTAYILPDHLLYETFVQRVNASTPHGPPLSEAVSLTRATCGVWLWV